MKLSFSQVLRGGMSPGAPVQYAAGDWNVCLTEKGSTLNPTTLAEGSCINTHRKTPKLDKKSVLEIASPTLTKNE